MKKYANLFCLCMLLSLFGANAQSEKSMLVINVYEHWNKPEMNKVIVTDHDKTVEEVALERWVPENLAANQVMVTKVLQKYRRQGYVMLSQSKGSLVTWGGFTAMVTTYLCEK